MTDISFCIEEEHTGLRQNISILLIGNMLVSAPWITLISPIITAGNLLTNESKSYDYSEPGFSEQTGPFTQLVWKATRQLRCAVTNNSAHNSDGEALGWFVVCEYAPSGNVVGRCKANVLPSTLDAWLGPDASHVEL